MKTLDFMIIGAQKAGTTALSQFLSQHPAVAIAKEKEVHLFSLPNAVEAWDRQRINSHYSGFFEGVDENLEWGEATPIYLYWPPIIPALKKYNAALKIIVLLRDPVERAISQYQMERVRKNEWLPLWLALVLEPLRLGLAGKKLSHAQRCYSYVSRGLYVTQLHRLREHFPDNQILILESNELRKYHSLTFQRVCKFLSIDICDVPHELIFDGGYAKRKHWGMQLFVRPFLKWRFRKANKQLEKLLNEMGVSCKWRWLAAE